MIFENSNDRQAQAETVDTVRYYFDTVPFLNGRVEIKETPEAQRLSHDFDVWICGLKYGVGEIKCRNRSHDQLKNDGWLIDKDRMNTLYAQQEKRGFQVIFVIRTNDDQVLFVTMQQLLARRSELKDAPKEWMRDNHGDQPAAREGLIVPGYMLQYMGAINL